MKIPVTFRVEFETERVTAIFPGMQYDNHTYSVEAYNQNEGWFGVDYQEFVRKSRPASGEERVAMLATIRKRFKEETQFRVLLRVQHHHLWYAKPRASDHLWQKR